MSCGLKSTYEHTVEKTKTQILSRFLKVVSHKIIVTRNVADPWRQNKWGTV